MSLVSYPINYFRSREQVCNKLKSPFKQVWRRASVRYAGLGGRYHAVCADSPTVGPSRAAARRRRAATSPATPRGLPALWPSDVPPRATYNDAIIVSSFVIPTAPAGTKFLESPRRTLGIVKRLIEFFYY